MEVFGHTVDDDFCFNPFYLALLRELLLTPPRRVRDTVAGDDHAADMLYYVAPDEVERKFVEFARQPFADEEILTKAAAGLYSLGWKYRFKRLFGKHGHNLMSVTAGILLTILAATMFPDLSMSHLLSIAGAITISGYLFLSESFNISAVMQEFTDDWALYCDIIAFCKDGSDLLLAKAAGCESVDEIMARYPCTDATADETANDGAAGKADDRATGRTDDRVAGRVAKPAQTPQAAGKHAHRIKLERLP